MQTDSARTSLLPSALVLSNLLAAHGGDPPFEALEQAGFRRDDIASFLEQRANRTRCAQRACS